MPKDHKCSRTCVSCLFSASHTYLPVLFPDPDFTYSAQGPLNCTPLCSVARPVLLQTVLAIGYLWIKLMACAVCLWTGLICHSTSEVQISLQLYILNVQATIFWNSGQDNHLSHWLYDLPSIILNKMIIFLFLFALNSDPLCLVHFGAFGNPWEGREECSIVFSLLSHLLPSHLPILALRKIQLFSQRAGEFGKFFILHIKKKYIYVNMYTLYRQCCVPLLRTDWFPYTCWENMGEHFKLQCFVLNYCDSVLALSGFLSDENQLYSTYWQKYLSPPDTAMFNGDHKTTRAFVWSYI